MKDGSWVRVVQGKILSVQRWSDSHISSSGGGGYVGPRGGVVHAPTIRSNIVQRSQVFVLRQDGIEESMELGDLMPLREGQTITAVYGGMEPESGHLLLLHNHQSTNTFAEPLRPSSVTPMTVFLVVLFMVWAMSALLVEPVASMLPTVQHSSMPVQSAAPQPLANIFTMRANQRYAHCLAVPHHEVPNCAGYEKVPTTGANKMCLCKSVAELLDDTRAELRQEAIGTPVQGTVLVASLIMIVVGGAGGIVAAMCIYRMQMRSGRESLRLFLVDTAEAASRISGIEMIATVDSGAVSLALRRS